MKKQKQKQKQKQKHNSMRDRIRGSMVIVIAFTMLIAYALTSSFVYSRIRELAETDIRYEAEYIAAAINISGDVFLKELDEVEPGTRVTLIGTDGDVEYDSEEDEYTFANHLNRPEVQQALKDGSGSDIRKSDTLGRDMFYSAVRLDDGRILRVSKPVITAFFTALEILPFILVIGILLFILAIVFAGRQSDILVEPINDLDLDDPLQNDVYEELTPLLKRIDKSNKEKEELANMRREFSANVSHELKTPLTSISGYAEIMRDGLVKPEDMPEFSDRIYKEANRLVTLINDIIKLSQLDENRVELEKENVNLNTLTEEIIQRLRTKARDCGVRVELTGEDCIVFGVRRVLDEMIYNLVENAIKYNRKNGSVRIRIFQERDKKKIIISDTGIGIPEEDRERVFERFYRVDKSRSKETGGTGLGLSIVKHGAILHNAEIELESTVNVGTKISIIFGMVPASA